MADWATRSGSRRGDGNGAPTDADERAEPEVDDWHWDWEDGPEEAAGRARPSAAGAASSRAGIIAPGDSPAEPGPERAPHSALVRRRRLVALVALGALFVLALVIPLVVFGGGGSKAEQTIQPPTTSAGQATSPARPATTTATTTAPSRARSSQMPLHVSVPANGALRRGERGSAVGQLQRGLAALGFATGTPDGIFGSTTELAVIDFQKSNNLTPDGVVGAGTARLLNAALAKKGVTK